MKRALFSLFISCSIGGLFAQKPIFTTAKSTSATVYFNSAELTQSFSVSLPKGNSEIVIKNVADYLVENTVQIAAPKNITVLSVQFTRNYISEYEIDETSPQIKKVRDSINIVTKEISRIQNTKVTENATIQLLDKNQQVYGANSGLSVAELTKMVEYYRTKRTEISNNILTLTEKETKLNETLKKLNDRLVTNASKEEKMSQGKLVLQVMNEIAGAANMEINYLTSGAGWQPSYELRAENISSPINMLYKGIVTQNTGVDWKQVKLKLSSGNPNQSNNIPLLQAWFLRYGNYGYRTEYEKKPSADAAYNTELSAETVSVQKAKKNESISTVGKFTQIIENNLNVSFDIDIAYDILSNGKQHSISLKEVKLPATYKYYAVPKLDNDAFLLAEIVDYSNYNLLPGSANIIFEGMYVGKTTVNPNQTSDTLNLSMGRDKKISIKREKIADKSGTKILSSYTEQTYTYDITLRNNKKENVSIVLKDQYPLSTDKDITVELLQSDRAKINAELGTLTWNVDLKPGETKKYRISYKVKYPKDKTIDNLY